MKSAEDYMRELNKLDGLRQKADTVEEAKLTIASCRNYQKHLRQIKNEVNLDIRDLRAHYRDLIASAGQKEHFIAGSFFGRRIAGSMRADNKRSLAAQRDDVIRSYETVKRAADALIAQLDRNKSICERFVEDEKAKAPASPTRDRPTPTASDAIEKIQRLAKLRDQGIITEDEFETKKKELLNRL